MPGKRILFATLGSLGDLYPYLASRLVRLGVARTIARSAYTARRAAKELGALLSDPRYRTNSERVASSVKAEDGTSAACDALESCLNGGA